MYLQHFDLEYPPFTSQPTPDLFFTQAERKNILKALSHDIQKGKTALLLTGPQGAGKTTFCRLIQHRLDGRSCKVLYLKNPVGSFENLLRQFCEQLGMTTTTDTAQESITVFHTLLQEKKKKGQQILLLIDEAEKIFLAALERLFRLLNEFQDNYRIQVLLVGQPELNASIEQLSSYCENVKIASSYALASFSKEETAAYLACRLRAARSTKDKKGESAPVFSEDAVHKIACLGKGIPGIMDEIAEAALEKAALNKADAVQRSHVSLPDKPQVAPVAIDEDKDEKSRTRLLLLSALFLLVLFFLAGSFFFSHQKDPLQKTAQPLVPLSPDKSEIPSVISEQEEAQLPFIIEEIADQVETPLFEPSASIPAASSSSTFAEEEEKPTLFSLPIPQRPAFTKKDYNESTEKDTDLQAPSHEESDADNTVVSFLEEEQEEVPTQGSETIPVLAPEELKHVVQGEPSSEVAPEPLTTAKKLPIIQPASIVELEPGMKKTRPSGSNKTSSNKGEIAAGTAPPKQKTLIPVASAQGAEPPAVLNASPPPSSSADKEPQAEPQRTPQQAPHVIELPKIKVTSVLPPPPSLKADQLFARYLEAGKQWSKKEYRNKFTVQLLVLSSDEVVTNIKDMIIRDEYQEYQEKLHILRRDTIPPTLFVCYGVYKSLDEARNVKNAMPLFLRKHHPYALPISDVLAKAKG